MANSKHRVSKSFTLAKDLDVIWSKKLLVNKDTLIRYAFECAVKDEAIASIFFGKEVDEVRQILFEKGKGEVDG